MRTPITNVLFGPSPENDFHKKLYDELKDELCHWVLFPKSGKKKVKNINGVFAWNIRLRLFVSLNSITIG